MKKNNVKAFTLVEMLIVIVIIGILIASLMPRMQSAQGRARDVARKNDLAQIQTAIITSQQDRGEYPGMSSGWVDAATLTADNMANSWLKITAITNTLLKAGMSSIPTDPNRSNSFNGLWATTYDNGEYAYMVSTRSSIKNGWFILMAKTEVEGSSNWVVCSGANSLTGWLIAEWQDLANITTCGKFEPATTEHSCNSNADVCYYDDVNELRYILMY